MTRTVEQFVRVSSLDVAISTISNLLLCRPSRLDAASMDKCDRCFLRICPAYRHFVVVVVQLSILAGYKLQCRVLFLTSSVTRTTCLVVFVSIFGHSV